MKFSANLISVLIILFGMVSFIRAGSIHGVVTDINSGIPVDNASLTAFGFDPTNPDSIIYRTFSATNGSYSFNNVIPATYYLWCEHPNYFSASHGAIVILDSTSSATVNFNLTPRNGGINNLISGNVYSTPRLLPVFIPLPGATVHLRLSGVSYDVVSDSLGYYEFTNIPPTPPGAMPYMLSAEAPGHHPAYNIDTISVAANTWITDLDIYLVPFDSLSGSTLFGFVYEIDSTGAIGPPIYPAKISLYPTSPVYSQYYMTYTNPDGSYQIDNIIPEFYDAVCEATGFVPEQIFSIDLTIGNATQDFFLIPDNTGGSATLSGWIYGDSANSIPLITVHPAIITLLGYTPMGDSLLYRTINNPNGSYLISGIIPGTYTAWCTAPGYQSQHVHNFVIADSINQLDFNLTQINPVQNGFITGSVFSDSSGIPVPWAFIEFISMNGFINFHTISDNSGNYISPPLPIGDYYVACYVISQDSNYFYMEYYDDTHSLADATILTVTQNDTIQGIDFDVPTSTSITNVSVSGIVTDDTNIPLENALVSVWVTRNPGTFGDSLVFHDFTDAQGQYTINLTNNIPMFAYSFIVSAKKPGYNIEFWQEKSTPWEADHLWVFNDTTFTGIDFTLEAFPNNNSISGTINSDSSGTPLGNAFIIAADLISGHISFTFSDNVGHYTLSFLNNSYYYLLFTANGHVPEFYDNVYVWENATPVLASGAITGIDASLAALTTGTSSGVISGTVLDDNTIPLSGVLLAIVNSTGDVIGYDMTDNQGNYEVTGVPDGNHQVSASKVSYSSQSQGVTFNLSLHNTLIVNFDLNLTTTGLPENPIDLLPTKLELLSNFPNPFNPETKISINLPLTNKVRLVIYNVLGQFVNELVNDELPAGTYTFIWNGTDISGKAVSTGVYFYAIETENRQLVKKMILSK
jgi:protocatechuate 3,4-dioxygenase beta subunit